MGMGGTGDGSYTENRVYVSPKGFKADQELNLICTYKVDNKKVEKRASWISGKLTLIKRSSFHYEGKEIETLVVHLIDESDIDTFNNELPVKFIIEMSWGGAARELVNRMAYLTQDLATNENITKVVTVGVYTTKKNDEGKIFKGLFLKYGSGVDIKQDDKCPAKWPWDKLKGKIKDVMVSGKLLKDYTELDIFFSNVISKMIQPKVVGDLEVTAPEKPKADPLPTYASDELDNPTEEWDDPTDDLPF